MSVAARAFALPVAWRNADWRHGARLAIAVVVSFGVSTAFGLPESLWAVMSALIVARPTAGSTLGAGWDRVRGAIGGTAIGLAGVWLHHAGFGTTAGAFAIVATVAAVAFTSAVVPALRSAPISALIVLNSGGIPGHTALDVAELRALEIAIGVATGVAVSLLAFAAHAREQFSDAAADWLRTAARHAVDDLTNDAIDAGVRETRRERARDALREIAVLAVGAGREARWLWIVGPRDSAPIDRVAGARTLTRVASDVAAVVRAADCAPAPLDGSTRRALADALAADLRAVADAIADTPGPRVGALRAWSSPEEAPVPWIAASTHLLLQDLRHLRRLLRPTG